MHLFEAWEVIESLKRLEDEVAALVLIPERLHNWADIQNDVVAELIGWMQEHTPTGTSEKRPLIVSR